MNNAIKRYFDLYKDSEVTTPKYFFWIKSQRFSATNWERNENKLKMGKLSSKRIGKNHGKQPYKTELSISNFRTNLDPKIEKDKWYTNFKNNIFLWVWNCWVK